MRSIWAAVAFSSFTFLPMIFTNTVCILSRLFFILYRSRYVSAFCVQALIMQQLLPPTVFPASSPGRSLQKSSFLQLVKAIQAALQEPTSRTGCRIKELKTETRSLFRNHLFAAGRTTP